MATATVRPADIEKVVHKVLEEERAENDRTTLRALQRVSSLLTEQVIPNLPDNAAADEKTGSQDEHDEEQPDSGPGSRMFAGRSARSDDDVADDEDPSDDDQTADVPDQVMKAFAALYRTLTPEQAEALGAFFTAVSEELNQSDDGDEAEDEDEDANPEDNPRLH